VTDDPGGVDDAAKTGNLSIRIGLGWAKSHVFTTGQCPVMRYNRQLMHAILYDKFHPAKAVNVTVIRWTKRLKVTRISIKARPRSSSSIRTGWWQRRSVSIRATLLAFCTDGARILCSLRCFARRHHNLLALSFLVLEIARFLVQLLCFGKRIRGVAVRARGPGDLDRILRLIESHGASYWAIDTIGLPTRQPAYCR